MHSDYQCNYVMLCAAIVAALAVAASNALFAYGLGVLEPVALWGVRVAPDGAALAAASATVAVCEATVAGQVLRPRKGENRILVGVLLVVCVSYSAGAMTHHVLELQRLKESGRSQHVGTLANLKDALADVERHRDKVETELKRLKGARSEIEISTEIRNLESDARTMRRTKNCTVAWSRTVDGCEALRALNEELAGALEKARLSAALAKGNAAVDGARAAVIAAREKAPKEPSPTEAFLGFWIAWALAAVVECVATFGFALSFRPKIYRPPTPPAASEPQKPVDCDILQVLEKVSVGAFRVPGATVDSDGWISLAQSRLAEALDMSKTTVNKQLRDLATSGAILKQSAGRATRIKVVALGVLGVSSGAGP